jgi:Zn-dependent peptidase ImmA (M78 family)
VERLSAEAIEAAAAELRDEVAKALGLEELVPFAVERVAEFHLGYTIDFFEMPEDILGGINFESKVIFVNPSVEAHEGRYSFTIAHEIGHHVLHRDAYLAGDGEAVMCRSGEGRPLEEMEADHFAEALLMPSGAVKDAAKASRWRGTASARGHTAFAADVMKISGISNVSVQAMMARLRRLGLLRRKASILALARLAVWRLLGRWV